MRYFVLLCMLIAKVFAFSSAIMPGMHALDFTLQDVHGQDVSLHDHAGKIIVLEWRDPRCDYVKKYYTSNKMQDLQKHYQEQFGWCGSLFYSITMTLYLLQQRMCS